MQVDDSVVGEVLAVCKDSGHRMTKPSVSEIRLVTGAGVEGDAHFGDRVQHLSRVARDPNQPNLRQVHLIHAELHDELRERGFDLAPGDMGENITTRAVPLLDLPRGTRLRIGASAIVELTGLRNPCHQLDRIQSGLMKSVLDRDDEGALIRKASVMGIVLQDGLVRPGDAISIDLPEEPAEPLAPV